jgi:hypothetical protein
VTAQCDDVTADLIALRVRMREITLRLTDKDAVRFEKQQSATCVCPQLFVFDMLQRYCLILALAVGTAVTAGKYMYNCCREAICINLDLHLSSRKNGSVRSPSFPEI